MHLKQKYPSKTKWLFVSSLAQSLLFRNVRPLTAPLTTNTRQVDPAYGLNHGIGRTQWPSYVQSYEGGVVITIPELVLKAMKKMVHEM